jgi:hypothetical protein
VLPRKQQGCPAQHGGQGFSTGTQGWAQVGQQRVCSAWQQDHRHRKPRGQHGSRHPGTFQAPEGASASSCLSPMTQHLNTPAVESDSGAAKALLCRLLCSAPVMSRDVVERMVVAGFTYKQIRGARLRLGVQVTRTGSGRASRSFWALPTSQPEGTSDLSSKPLIPSLLQELSPKPQRSARVRARAERLGSSGHEAATPSLDVPPLSPGELDRLEGRTGTLVLRGLDPSAARQLAIRLVVERDRVGLHATGSCIECQVRDECPDTQPWEEVHQCWRRRVNCP